MTLSTREQFKNYCSRASTGRAALQRRVPADPSPPSRLQPAAPRPHKKLNRSSLRAAHPRVGSVLVVSNQSGDEDASGRRAQTVYTGIGDINAGVVPTRRDLVENAFVVRDQDPGGPNGDCIPLKGAYRKRRLDDVEFVLADCLDCSPQ